jgi:hypothetical protein
MYDHLKLIINLIPINVPHSSLCCSVYLFSMYTGARALTLDNMKVNDIISKTYDISNIILCLLITKSKKTRNFSRIYTLDYRENDDKSNSMNFIKWFRLYLLETYNFDMVQSNDIKLLKSYRNMSLWITKDLKPLS